MQCVAMCCSVLLCVAVCCNGGKENKCFLGLQVGRTYWVLGVLQCVAVCCSVLQCVAVAIWKGVHFSDSKLAVPIGS